MLDIFLNILSILGIVLLILLCTALVLLLLVLFFPISYRLKGLKNEEQMTFSARVSWLFGLLRVQYVYPKPGELVIKILCFRLKLGKDKKDSPKESSSLPQQETVLSAEQVKVPSQGQDIPSPSEQTAASPSERESASLSEQVAVQSQGQDIPSPPEQETAPSPEQEPSLAGISKLFERISAKYENIKYTIKKICDRIRHIWKNITFYSRLLTEENTRELFGHACIRIGKVLKSIRPRKWKADVLFGAASPDTTGYLYGIYGMLSPQLGKNITVVPDFERAVLEGAFSAKGHITAFQILIQGILLLVDKRLRRFLRRIKRQRAAQQ
ncbi:MAG: hypothetical protein NC417_05305 [Candidatus Gastranaerophilales bacterium]|nr:hypothetical protein [Candidatus Gastranaerophilales bacterium]